MIHDAGKNFVFIEFKLNIKSMDIEIIEMSVEAYNSVRKVERYHALLRRVY